MLWERSLDNCWDTEMNAQIRGIDLNMCSFDYVFGAYLGKLIIGHSDNLSKFLLKLNLSSVDGQCTASATVEILKSVRNDESFDLLWEKVLNYFFQLIFVFVMFCRFH